MSVRRLETVKAAERTSENSVIEKRQRREGLILRGRRHTAIDSERREKCDYIGFVEILRMPPPVKANESANPMDVRRLRPPTIAPFAQPAANHLHQPQLELWRRRR
jgi:hypothetical protein